MTMGAVRDGEHDQAVRREALGGERADKPARLVEVPRIGLAKGASAEDALTGGAPSAASASSALAGGAPSAAEDYLGPGQVTSAEGGRVVVELPGGRSVDVVMALALPYEPAPGDTLLVIGRRESHYAIGVLHGTGRTVLSLPGDVAVHAAGGALSLSGDQGVAIRGPELDVQVGKIQTVAGAVVQKVASLYQRVSALFSVHAGEAHTVVEKTSFTKAKNATLLTEETVTVNGKQILLG
jgi:hypothetical protein